MAKQLNVKLNFQADTTQAQQALAQLTTSLNQISNITPTVGNKLNADLTSAKQSALDLQMHLNNAFNVKTGNLDLGKLDASLKSSGQNLGTLSTNLLKAGTSGQNAFLNIQRAIGNASVQINQANGALTQFWTTLKNTARWQLSSSLLHGFIGGLQSAWGYAKDLDKSLNNIRIVTGYSSEEMVKFAEQANKAAKALSTTTTKYTDASLIFYQQGLSAEEVAKRTEVAIKMANVSGQSTQVVADQMTAVWNNFYDGTKSLEYYADVMTALGAATASSTDEIAGGLEKFAAIGETIGLSYEYAASALATITANTRQSEDVVGTALKTIFARIQGLNLGETLDDGTTLNKYSQALEKVGISIFEQNGQLKDMDSILNEMGSKWQTLAKDQQTALAQTVAGVRQYTQLVALMDNWNAGDSDSMQANLRTSYNAEGTVNKQQEIYADSWQAAVDRVKASAEGIYKDLFPTEEMTGMMKAFEVILEGVDGLVEGLGGLQGILLLVSSIALNAFRNQIGGAIDDIIAKVGGGLTNAFTNISNAFQSGGIISGLKAMFNYTGNVVTQTQKLSGELQTVATHSGDVTKQMSLTEQAMKGGVSQALKMSMEMTQAAHGAKGLFADDAFQKYNANLATINNVQASIEKSTRYLTKEQQEQLVVMQEQAQAANEQLLTAQRLEVSAKRRKEAMLDAGGSQGANLDRYVEIDKGKNAGKTAYATDLINTGSRDKGTGNIGMVSAGLESYAQAAKTAGEAWDAAKVSLDSYKNHLALVFDESVNLTQVNKEVNTAYSDLVTTSADVSDAMSMWGTAAQGVPEAFNTLTASQKEAYVAAVELDGALDSALGDVSVPEGLKTLTDDEKKAVIAAQELDKALEAALDDLSGKGKLGAQLAAEIRNSAKSATTLQGKAEAVSKGLAEASEKMRTLGIATGSSEKDMENFKNGALEARDRVIGTAQAADNLNNKLSQVVGTLQKSLAGAMSFGKTLAGAASGLSSIAMGISSIQNAFSTFNDEDASFTSKLTAGAMAATMGIRGMMAAMSGVSAIVGSVNAALGINEAATMAVAVASGKKTEADLISILTGKLKMSQEEAEAASKKLVERAQKGETAATIKDTAANWANVASQAAKLWYIALILAIVAALTAAIYFLVTAEDAETKALKASTAALEEASEAYDKAKEAVQNFKDQVADYKDAINGLKELESGTDEMREAVEEANKKARELIETFKLFGQYTYGANGEIIFNQGALEAIEAGLRENEARAERQYNLAALRKQEAQTNFDNKNFAQNAKITYDVVYKYSTDGTGIETITEYLDPSDYVDKAYGSWYSQGVEGAYYDPRVNDTRKTTRTLNADDLEAFNAVINKATSTVNEATGELNKVPATTEELRAYIEQFGSECGVSNQILMDLDSFLTDSTFETIMSFSEGMDAATAASLYYAEQLLGLFTDDEYKAGIERAAGGDKTREGLMYQAKDTMVSGATIEYNGKTMTMAEYTQARGEELDVATGNRTGNKTEKQIKSNIENITGEDGETWLKNNENYSAIFGEGKTYDGNISTEEMARDYFEAQGWEIQSLGIEDGKIVMSGTNATTGEKASGEEFDFDVIQTNWSDMINDYLLDQDISTKVAEGAIDGYLDPEAFEAAMTNIVAQGEQFGTDWTNAILTGIANGGKFDFSTVFQFLSPEEMNQIEGMSDADIVKTFLGIDVGEDGTSPELTALGFDNATAFADGFRDGLTSYDPKVFQNAMNDKYEALASSYDIDENEFRAYRSQIQEGKGLEDGEDEHNNNPMESLNELKTSDLEQYNEVLNEIALTQARLSKGYKTLGENWEDWNDIMSNTEASAEDVAGVMKDLAPAMADILNWDMSEVEMLPASFFQTNWPLIQQVYEGVDGAQEKLNGLATREYLIQLGIDGSGLEGETLEAYNALDTILKDMPDMEVGMTLNDSGMYSALQALLDAGVLTKDQMNDVLSQIGFTPEIEEQKIEFNAADATQTETGYDYSYTDPLTGETRTAHITQEDYAAADSSGFITIPVINGKETTYSGGGGASVKPPKDQGKNSGGGGGGSPKKAEPTRKADVVERYKEINDQIDDMQEAMDDANRAADKLWGANRLAMMKKVAGQMEDELDALREKKRLAEETYLAEDLEDLNEATDDAGVARFEFDANNNIINYDEIMGGLYDELHAAEEEAGEEWSESEQEKIDAIQERIDKVKEAQENYDATKEEIEDWQNEIEETLLAIQQQYFDIWAEGIEIDLAIDEADLAVIEYYLSKVQDDIYGIVETLTLTKQQADIAAGNLDQYAADKAELDRLHTEINPETGETYINDAQYIEGLQDLQSKIYENLDAINAATDAYQNAYSDALAAAAEELANYTDQMEHHNSVLEHYNNLLNLTGQSKNYEKMNNVLEAQVSTAKNMAAVSKSNYDMLVEKAKEKEAAWLAVGKDPGKELTEQEQAIKNEWLAAQQAANEAQDQMLSDAEAWAEALNALLENKLANLADILNDKLAGDFGSLEDMNTAMERASSLQEEYLTTTNKIYETNKLMNTAQQEIDKTTNTVAKRRLKAYIEETEQLQNKNKLSQYELDIQQAKYDLLLAEIALEEAQDAKSTVRLQRDAEGNFGYVYTADQDAVADAEQKLADAQNALYNIGLEGANDYTEKYAATIQEMNDEITALTQAWQEGEIASEKEYQDQMAALKKYYYEKLEGYSELYGIAITTDGQVVQDAWSTQFAGMTANTEEWMNCVDEYVTGVRTAFSDWATEMEEVTAYTIGENLTDLAGKTQDIKNKSDELVTTITNPTNGVIKALEDELDAVDEVSQAYWEWYQNILSVIEAAENLGGLIADIIEEESEEDEEDPSGDPTPPTDPDPTPPTDPDPPTNTLEVGQSVTVKKSATNFSRNGGNGTKMKSYVPGGTYTVMEVDGDEVRIGRDGVTTGWVKKTDLEGFDTGGYTGSWGPYGKLAMLHEKELVLNAHDTDNFLNTMEVMERILQMLDLQTMSSQIGGILSSPGLGDTGSQIIEQHIEIEANFPDATDRFEIEEAFKSMANLASQYANRK